MMRRMYDFPSRWWLDMAYLAWTNIYGDLIGKLEVDHFIGWSPTHIDEVPLFDRLLDELLLKGLYVQR